jgi:putative SOS response-associated peptidase YedK
MCGRFALFASGDEAAKRFQLAEAPLFNARYNIAPTQPVAAVRPTAGEREFALFHWGLIPSWETDPAIGNRLINDRAENRVTPTNTATRLG